MRGSDIMYKIGEFAKICNISVKTLRFYADEGVLVPRNVDIYTGYRYYDDGNIAEACFILELKEMGFSLAEIREYIKSEDAAYRAVIIDKKRDEIIAEKKALDDKLKKLSAFEENFAVCGVREDV
jgi:DNA-binding transcriptional MerR regulator